MECGLKPIRERVKMLEDVVHFFATSQTPPLMYHSGVIPHGYRYMNPSAETFFAVKGASIVSGLNACLRLAEVGHINEMNVLMRSIVESATHIEYVLVGITEEGLGSAQQRLVEAFFADFHRPKRQESSETGGKKQSVSVRKIYMKPSGKLWMKWCRRGPENGQRMFTCIISIKSSQTSFIVAILKSWIYTAGMHLTFI